MRGSVGMGYVTSTNGNSSSYHDRDNKDDSSSNNPLSGQYKNGRSNLTGMATENSSTFAAQLAIHRKHRDGNSKLAIPWHGRPPCH